MAGVSIDIDAGDLEGAFRFLRPLLEFEPSELMTAIGAIGESQTRRRISEEKTAPDGTPWQPNRAGTPILVETGQHLLYSIAWTASADEAEWGATWEHASVHHHGAVIEPKSADALRFKVGERWVTTEKVEIPARPFVGLSPANIAEMQDVISDHFGMLGR